MKGPITAVQARWKLAGVDPSSGYTYQTFPLGVPVNIHRLTPGLAYEVGLRYLGPLPSDWTTITHTVAASNRQGVRALPPGSSGNVGSRWVSGATVTWTATDTLATIDVSAGDLQIGDDTVSYSASSAQVSGVASEVKTVHLYYDDPGWNGGTRTLGVTEDITETVRYRRIYIASLQITFDSAGGTGTSGGGGIGGGGGGSGQFEP